MDKFEDAMREKDQKLTLCAKIFLIIAISVFVLSNIFAIFMYYAFF